MMQSKKIESQSRSAATALRLLLAETFSARRPADRTLAAFFRANHQYGSRDRQVISETLFAVFRWWGALRTLLPAETRTVLETPGNLAAETLELKFAAALMLGATLLEGRGTPEVAGVWAQTINLKTMPRCEANQTPAMRLPKIIPPLAEALNLPLPTCSAEMLLPEWIYPQLGENAAEFITWCQKRPPLWLRVQGTNPAELARLLATHELVPECHPRVNTALCLREAKVNLYSLPEFRSGWFEVQDLASQVIGLACAPIPGERWWDACAGAGGKSLQLAELLQRRGSVIATDIREYKLDDLRKRARRAGFPNIICKEWDGKPPRRQHKYKFDGVLVDAPCSCSGTWRRNPDARWTTTADEITEMAELQARLIRNAAPGVKPGGVLIYATCSVIAAENLGVVNGFLADYPDFTLEPFTHPLNGSTTDGTLQVQPWEGDCDAMFVARMRRATKPAEGDEK